MLDEEEDVNAVSSAATEQENQVTEKEEVVKEQSSGSQEDSSVQTGVETDEKGVPWKNREAEIRRKIQEEMRPFIQQQIQEGIKQGIPAPAAIPAQTADPIQSQLAPYNDDQLEAFASTDIQNAPLYRRELNRRIKDSTKREVLDAVKAETTKDKFEREQQQAIGYIQQTFPDAFMNIGGQGMWNTGNAVVQKAFAIYNSDPAFKAHGGGLRAAFLQAKGELSLEESSKITKQKVQLTAQQRKQDKTQAASMSAGGQSAPIAGAGGAKVKLQKLLEQHAKTGDPKIMAEILKMKNIMPV